MFFVSLVVFWLGWMAMSWLFKLVLTWMQSFSRIVYAAFHIVTSTKATECWASLLKSTKWWCSIFWSLCTFASFTIDSKFVVYWLMVFWWAKFDVAKLIYPTSYTMDIILDTLLSITQYNTVQQPYKLQPPKLPSNQSKTS